MSQRDSAVEDARCPHWHWLFPLVAAAVRVPPPTSVQVVSLGALYARVAVEVLMQTIQSRTSDDSPVTEVTFAAAAGS
ncbi:MAG: hypothetical protein EBT79_12950 [Actinobacteria bacterium]|nr:hypothetical protein [Actinomycetota bacterium]NBR68154.1 hypothetical protein [Actinomycetota bacterium]